jgi:hypothetical protein
MTTDDDFEMDDTPPNLGGDRHAAPTTGLEAPRVSSDPTPAAVVPPEAIGQGADDEPRIPSPAQPAAHQQNPGRNGVWRSPLTSRPPPASEQAEHHVLAACFLDDGATLDRARATLSPAEFHYPENAILFRQLCALRDDGLPLTPEALATYRAAHLQGVNPMLLVQLTDPSSYPTTAHAGRYIAEVADLARRRALLQHASAVQEAIARGVPTPDLPPTPTPPALSTSIPAHLDARRVRFTAPPPEPVTRLFLAGKPIATPGNLVTVIARSKTGKTASLGAAVAAILGAHYDRHDLDTFKFTAPHTDEAVILIDTEQSPYDAWTCHSRTMARAGQPPDPEWLHHYALVGDSAQDLRKSLPVALARGQALHKGVFCVILDGVADFVASVNDEAECNEFITYLRALAVSYNCPIICVIHSNEGVKNGDDGRGHLGKQLTRKAESNLLLKKVGDVTTVTSEKQRKAPITEADGVAFRWSDEHGRHISCDNPEAKVSKGGRKSKYDAEAMLSRVPAPDQSPKALPAIHRDVGTLPCSIDIRTFKDYMAKWIETGEVERIPDRALGFVFKRRY